MQKEPKNLKEALELFIEGFIEGLFIAMVIILLWLIIVGLIEYFRH